MTTISPDGVNLRSGPSTTANVVAVIPLGTALSLTGDSTPDGWYPVTYLSNPGWAFGAYLAQGTVSPDQAQAATPLYAQPPVPITSTVFSAPPAPAGQTAAAPVAPAVLSGGPTPSLSTSSSAPSVKVTTAPSSAPAPQVVASPASAAASLQAAPAPIAQSSGSSGTVSASLSIPIPAILGGGHATLTMTVNTDALNVRTAPDPNSSVLTAAPMGTAVQVTGAPINNWLPVRLGNMSGWMDAAYLSTTASLNGNSLANSSSTGTTTSTPTTNSTTTLTAAAFGNPTLGTPAGPETGLEVAALPPTTPGEFIWPVTLRRISTTFKGIHQAIDIDQFPAGGNPAVATADGVVTFAGGDACCSYGLYVIMQHANGFSSLYAHLSKISVSQGQIVTQGQQLGLTGNTGNSTGPHIHYAMYYKGLPFDPLKILAPGADIEPGA